MCPEKSLFRKIRRWAYGGVRRDYDMLVWRGIAYYGTVPQELSGVPSTPEPRGFDPGETRPPNKT
jgi:hypothetical protein